MIDNSNLALKRIAAIINMNKVCQESRVETMNFSTRDILKDDDQDTLQKTNASTKSSKSCLENGEKQRHSIQANRQDKTNTNDDRIEKYAQNEQIIPEMSLFMHKRKFLMMWIQNFGQRFMLARETVGLAQNLCDSYYSVAPYHPNTARQILVAIMVVASKLSDTKILLSSQIAYIFQIQYIELERIQLEIATQLDFQLNIFTYVKSIDYIIDQMSQLGVYHIYQQSLEAYTKLRCLHWLAETLYLNHINVSQLAIAMCFQQVFQFQSKSASLTQFLNSLSHHIPFGSAQALEISAIFSTLRTEWPNYQQKIQNQFLNRRQSMRNYHYTQFIFRYFAN